MNNGKIGKEFGVWHKLKNDLYNTQKKKIFFKEREIWFCSIGLNVGQEQDGKHKKFERPVLILKKFNNNLFVGLPLTSRIKSGKHYYNFRHKNRIRTVILSQIRLLDSKRLRKKFDSLPKNEFEKIKDRMIKLLR